MPSSLNDETTGAWIIHHGRKIAQYSSGAAEYPVLDETAKASLLLSRLAESKDATLVTTEVGAIARAAGLNTRLELPPLLRRLEERRLIDRSAGALRILGLTGRAVLRHATALFREAGPSVYEDASITLAEASSRSPIRRKEAAQIVGDQHEIRRADVPGLLERGRRDRLRRCRGRRAGSAPIQRESVPARFRTEVPQCDPVSQTGRAETAYVVQRALIAIWMFSMRIRPRVS